MTGGRLAVLLLLSVWLAALPARAEFTEGVEYIEIAPQPVETGDKVEVREFFWYGCPHCYHLEPTLKRWHPTMSKKAEFIRTPANFRPVWEVHARAFFVFQGMGINEKMDNLFFRALHEQNRKLDDENSIAAFVREHGIDEKQFREAYRSFGVVNSVQHAMQLQKRYGINSVPMLIVDGKYVTNGGLTHGNEELMQVVDFLIEKAARERKQPARGKK